MSEPEPGPPAQTWFNESYGWRADIARTQRAQSLACGFGLVPNIELPLALGCELDGDFVRVNEVQATTVANVYCAGEPTGIGGAEGDATSGLPFFVNMFVKS